MAKVYTTSTASIKVPVVLSFNCPACGQFGNATRTAYLSAQSTVRGYNSSAANMFAQQNLAASADSQVQSIVNSLEKGYLNALRDEKGVNPGGKVLCPHCGLRQIPDMTDNRSTLYAPSFGWIVFALIFAGITLFSTFMAVNAATNSGVSFAPAAAALSLLVSIGAVVTMVVVNRRQSKKAYDDPALMVKRYKSVLNPHMDAVIMLGIGNTRTVRIPAQR